MRSLAAFLIVLAQATSPQPIDAQKPSASHRPVRLIGATPVVGDSHPRLWAEVLGLLPTPPARIVIVDLDALSIEARARIGSLEAFVLSGNPAVFVVRQGVTLRHAELGGALDRLMLASVIWHEMGHLEGLDEPAALLREAQFWRELVGAGRIESGHGLSIAAELEARQALARTSRRAPDERSGDARASRRDER